MSAQYREIIASILNIENNSHWEITDFNEEKGLCSVHYAMNLDDDLLEEIGHLRGVVVDINAKKVVCKSYGYTPSIVRSNTSGDSDLTYKVGYEGTIIRVFKHAGVVYASTHKRLVPIRSRWGQSNTFAELYDGLNGPKEQLFDDKLYSPYVYVFLIVHPQLLFASKMDLEPEGRLVFLERFTMDLGDSFENVETEPHGDEYVAWMPQSETITSEQADQHLATGFAGSSTQSHRLLGNGEFVIGKDPKGKIYRVVSPAYNWRVELRQGDSNLYHNYVMLLNYAKVASADDEVKFSTTFPKVDLEDPEVKAIVADLPQVDKDLYNPYIKAIFVTFMLTVPISARNEVKGFYAKYFTEVKQVANWLANLNSEAHISKDAKEIIEKSKAQTRLKPSDPKYREAFYQNVKRNLIFRNKKIVYQLVREMKKFRE